MNVRIIEITAQAYQFAVAESKCGANACKVGSDFFLTIEKLKFAELIVKDCISVMRSTVYESIDLDRKLDETSAWIESDIKQHFGIE